VFLDFYVVARCSLGFTICGSYMEQVWQHLECPFNTLRTGVRYIHTLISA